MRLRLSRSMVRFLLLFFPLLAFAHPPKVALCYWGLTRSTTKVASSHDACLFKVLKKAKIGYDVFIHTWRLHGKQRVWGNEITTPVNYREYKLLHPKYYKIDDQDLFTNSFDLSDFFDADDPRTHAWPPCLIFNHLCALESLKRVTDMVLESGNTYDVIIYVRPDVLLRQHFPVDLLKTIQDNDILIPDFDHYNQGYNDRFAALNYKTAPIYGKRIEEILDFRKTGGHITSEGYVKYICDQYHLNVRMIDFHFDIVRP